jgi:hypothetical protein
MIGSLADAWRWYESVSDLTRAMRRLGDKHWDHLPWEGDLGKDSRLRHLEAAGILDQAEAVLRDLDDLCVRLLFSVFEAIVRDQVLREVQLEASGLRHPAVRHAVGLLTEAIEHGSFYKVLEAYKGLDADLIEEVNQVRRYRNWVAHGRRGAPATAVDPRTAYERLQRFLDRLEEAPPGPALG